MRAGHEVRIVTVSREYGAGGGQLAAIVGERLGWRVVDRQLLEQVAQRLQATPAEIQLMDESIGGLLERLLKVFRRGAPEFVFSSEPLDPEAVARVEGEMIRAIAESPPAVIVGRGAQCLLSGRPEVLHVRVVAPLEIRAARIAESLAIPVPEARAQTIRLDAERVRYVRHHFRCELNEPQLYDLQVNTGAIAVEEAAGIVLGIIGRTRSG